MSSSGSNEKTVLVTGINGYIASVLGAHLLKKGYSVRGTVRKASSADGLLKGPYAVYRDHVEILEVPDMTVKDAFDVAARGVDGIFHTASPINWSLQTYDDFVPIAVAGNENLLASALRAGPQLTSVVVTSSTVAVLDPHPEEQEYVFTEKDFGSFALEEARKDKDAGKITVVPRLYAASKIAAERYLWKFRDVHKPTFSISCINPAVVCGPPVFLPSNPSGLNETLAPFYKLFSGSKEIPADTGSASTVDVRDVALMHIWAYENPGIADGQRYIACCGKGPLQAVSDILRHHYKGTTIGDNVAIGIPGHGYIGYDDTTETASNIRYPPGSIRVDGSHAEKVMGFKYIPVEQTAIDTAKAMEPYLKL